jgi:hypothetical protein
VDDARRQPKDSDRQQVAARVQRAFDAGRIGGADRDIRLGNVQSATSMAELDLMTRELDQLEASPAPAPATVAGGVPTKPWSKFDPGKGDDDETDDAGAPAATAGTAPRSRAGIVTVLIAIAILVAAVALFLNYRASGHPSNGPAVDPAGAPHLTSDASASPGATTPGGGTTVPAGTTYTLTGDGIRGFLQTYRKRFGTSQVVDLTLYGDYVIVGVPVPGKARQSGWLFRPASGWTSFGGVRAVFPGSQPVDTNRLVIPALIRNIARARATLNVEAPQHTYVIVRNIRGVDVAPAVDIHVANGFNESGYLATTLDGKVKRAFPYSP